LSGNDFLGYFDRSFLAGSEHSEPSDVSARAFADAAAELFKKIRTQL
jgi:hypothetical protein